MRERFAFWWRARSPRERGLLAVMFALAALVVLWLLVVRPLSDALDAQKTRHAAAVVALSEARARTQGNAAAGPAGPVASLVGRTAAEAGFAGARVASEGPARSTVAIDAARPQALFTWLARLEQGGVVVTRLRAQANSDRTLAVEAALRARGR
jgi:general secretion pathway protein M